MRQNPDFVARRVGGELVLVPITREASELDSVFTLNGVAASIWDLIGECSTAEEIAERLVAAYEVDEVEALEDVRDLIDQLREARAVVD